MTKIKLIALDLDGTLLDKQKKISVENLSAIRAARAQGVHVVFDTGRPLVAVKEYMTELGMNSSEDFAVILNGGQIWTGAGRLLFDRSLTYDEVCEIHALARSYGLPIDILSAGVSYTIEYERPSRVRYINNTLDFRTLAFQDLPKNGPFNKIVLSADADYLAACRATFPEEINNQFEIFKTRDILLEFMPKGVDKASGLARLCEHLSIQADEVLAMGDEANDAPMLSWAGLGIAPANANASAREKADQILAVSNDEAAVAAALNKYVL